MRITVDDGRRRKQLSGKDTLINASYFMVPINFIDAYLRIRFQVVGCRSLNRTLELKGTLGFAIYLENPEFIHQCTMEQLAFCYR